MFPGSVSGRWISAGDDAGLRAFGLATAQGRFLAHCLCGTAGWVHGEPPVIRKEPEWCEKTARESSYGSEAHEIRGNDA